MRIGLMGLSVVVTLLLGCSGDSTTLASPNDSGSATDGPGSPDGAVSDAFVPTTDSGGDAALGPYPVGPYGTTVGSVIANMKWIGFVDDAADMVATKKPYVMYSLDDARKSGKHYAMLNLSESYCPGCQKSAGEIEAGGAAVVNAGGVMIEILETTGFVTQASMSGLTAWVDKYSLPVTTVKDPDGTGTPTLMALGQREQAYIIDLTTMKILQIIAGDITGAGATSGGKGMAAMHTLLGK